MPFYHLKTLNTQLRTNWCPHLVISRTQFIFVHFPHLAKLTALGYWESSWWKIEKVIKKHTKGRKKRKKWWCLPHSQHWIVIFFLIYQLELYERVMRWCNSCVVNCQDHSGTAAAARPQARLLDTVPASSPLRSQSHNFGPGQVEKELPVRNRLSQSAHW